MAYKTGYRRGYRNTPTVGRVAKPNRRPGPCRGCGEDVPAGAGQLWRETDGSWSVVHTEAAQGGWLMNPQPVRGGCPESTDKRNAELAAAGFFGPGAPAPASEREHIASVAALYAATAPSETPRRSYGGRSYAYTGRCTHEDYPCCGCGD